MKGNINNIADKDTIDNTLAPVAPDADTPDADAQDAWSTDPNSPYSLRNRKFPPYSINTTINQKKKEKKIDDKVTIGTTPALNAPNADTPNSFAQDSGSIDSYLPYYLRNFKSPPTPPTQQKTRKRGGNIDDKVIIDTNPAPYVPSADTSNVSD